MCVVKNHYLFIECQTFRNINIWSLFYQLLSILLVSLLTNIVLLAWLILSFNNYFLLFIFFFFWSGSVCHQSNGSRQYTEYPWGQSIRTDGQCCQPPFGQTRHWGLPKHCPPAEQWGTTTENSLKKLIPLWFCDDNIQVTAQQMHFSA